MEDKLKINVMKPTELLRREYKEAIKSVMPSTAIKRYNMVREFVIELGLVPFTEILLIEFEEEEKLKYIENEITK